MKPGPHYVNTQLLKIQFSFAFLCLLLTLSLFLIYQFEQKKIYFIFIPLAGFIILKLVVHYLIYKRIKYKDDGRELVSFADFFTIQLTFPFINSWITY